MSAFTPWVLAVAIFVASTDAPRDDPQAGSAFAPPYRSWSTPDGTLVARAERVARPSPQDAREGSNVADAASVAQDGPSLRAEFKRDGGGRSTTSHVGKGDPWRTVPVSFSRRGVEIAAATRSVATRLAFARDAAVLPPTVLMQGPHEAPDWAASRSLIPWTGAGPTLTRNTRSVQSPGAAAAGSTGAAHAPARLGGDGATPRTARALVLSSATPAPADATPVQVVAAPVSVRIPALLQAAAIGRGTPLRVTLPLRVEPDLRPRYGELLDPDKLDREQRCLAEAVYFEARSESEQGQAAVAQVVLNRVRSGLYPLSVCDVVYQNRHRHLACQFTFACEGKVPRVTEPEAWDAAKRIALDVTDGRTYLADVGGATHYHADYVRPSWARRLQRMDAIGRHVFYQLRPGQT